jgi:ribosome-binding factor A
LKRKNRDYQFEDSDFAEALSDSGRQQERKTQQLCRQVQRSLNAALGMRGLFVEEVSPAPDCGHLLVRVLIPEGLPVAETMMALRREAPRLRGEVASSITRKRAPALSFVPAFDQGGSDD